MASGAVVAGRLEACCTAGWAGQAPMLRSREWLYVLQCPGCDAAIDVVVSLSTSSETAPVLRIVGCTTLPSSCRRRAAAAADADEHAGTAADAEGGKFLAPAPTCCWHVERSCLTPIAVVALAQTLILVHEREILLTYPFFRNVENNTLQ